MRETSSGLAANTVTAGPYLSKRGWP